MRHITLGLIAMTLTIAAVQQLQAGTFGDDLAFLKKHTDVILLGDPAGGAQVALSPKLQGRVMTSTAEGTDGLSFGWINRELFEEGKFRPHINPFGGEDRFWLGPEGGQFAIFFKKGDAFDLEHWQTPPAIDTEPFEVVSQAQDKAVFHRKCQLTNYSGTQFEADINREIRLLKAADAWKELGMPEVAGVKMVAFETNNKLTNAGKEPWKKETGLLSVWILGMFNASPTTTIAIPIKGGAEADLGPAVNADYFGKVPAERLTVKNDVVYFSGDAKCRSKIGISPKRCKPIMGSYDATNKVLTVVQFTLPAGKTDYVNSMWQIQEKPYGGDVANSYNDGPPPTGGKQLGQFYELESSSPAAALAAGESLTHVHRTFHFKGAEAELEKIAKAALGVGLKDISGALPK